MSLATLSRCTARCFGCGMLLIALLFAGSFHSLFAQEVTGTILGIVTDSSGAVVPGAKVTITNTDRNAVERTAKTSKEGEYSAPLLPIGHYSVTIETPGFKKTTQTDIILNVNDRRSVAVVLEVGSDSETVTVEANALQVNSDSDAATGLITGTQVRELALQSRNYEEMVQLMPGVSADIGDALYAGVSAPNGNTNETAFSLNGSFGSSNSWTVDGADNVDRGGNFSLLNYPSVDAIDEFKVLRGNYSAEYGRSAGGVINVITRSGKSKFHGGAYEFFRNNVLDANDWGNKQQSPVAARTAFRYHDFGWTLGGPVFIPHVYNAERNKTFFFYSEELRRVIQQNPVTGVVPDANERAGNFEDPVCSVNPTVDPTGARVCPGQVITNISSINPAAVAYLKDIYSHLPLPSDPSTDLLFANEGNVFNFQQEIGRIDHTFNSKLSGFVRYMQDSIPTVEGGGLFNGNPLPNVTQTSTDSPGQNVAANLTWIVTPTLVNEVEYAWSSGAIKSHNSGQLGANNSPDVVSAITLPFLETLNRIPSIGFGVSNASFFGFGSYGDFNKNNAIFDNLTKTVGKHSLKFGFSYNHYEKSENSGGNNAGTFNFAYTPYTDPNTNPKAEFEQEFAMFLSGQPSQFTQLANDFRAVIFQNQLEFYGQDAYKPIPNLTVSFGLRYSIFRQPTDGNGRATNFAPTRYNAAKAPAIDDSGNVVVTPNYDPLNGVIIGGNANGAHNSPYGTAVAPQFHNGYQPRFGFSFDPWNNGKTAIRGGYGIFLDSPGVGFLENSEFINPPFVGNTTISGGTFNNPGAGTTSNNSVQSVGGVSTDWHQPYAQQWDLDIQREIPYDIILDVGYYGSKGTHQLSQVDINQPLPGAYVNNATIETGLGYDPTATPPVGLQHMNAGSENLLNIIRPYQGYGPIDIYEPIFSSNYNSFQSSLQKRFKGGSQVSANYTWSKSLTDRPDQAGGNLPVPQNSYNLRAEYGPSRFDRRNVFNANWVYELPFFAEQKGLVGRVVGGWEFSGIVQLQSGHWFSAIGNSNDDPGGLGVFTSATAPNFPRPDQIGNPNRHAPHTIASWYDTSVFTDVPANQFRPGNAPRGTILGPGAERWDLALLKNIKVYGDQSFQFRAEAFNAFNHTNYNNLDTTQGDGNTGVILGAGEKRILQVALKYNF